jgi:hypothetical protein
MAQQRHDHRISAAQETQLVEDQRVSYYVRGDNRIFRQVVAKRRNSLISDRFGPML